MGSQMAPLLQRVFSTLIDLPQRGSKRYQIAFALIFLVQNFVPSFHGHEVMKSHCLLKSTYLHTISFALCRNCVSTFYVSNFQRAIQIWCFEIPDKSQCFKYLYQNFLNTPAQLTWDVKVRDRQKNIGWISISKFSKIKNSVSLS